MKWWNPALWVSLEIYQHCISMKSTRGIWPLPHIDSISVILTSWHLNHHFTYTSRLSGLSLTQKKISELKLTWLWHQCVQQTQLCRASDTVRVADVHSNGIRNVWRWYECSLSETAIHDFSLVIVIKNCSQKILIKSQLTMKAYARTLRSVILLIETSCIKACWLSSILIIW